MNPVFKIETLTGAVLDHTIIDEADNIYCKSAATDAIGHFVFSVPTRKGGSYYYDDVALFDKVKIYLGYDSVPANPNFIGRINNISAPLNTGSGYIRTISGFDQGEILKRRFKRNKYYSAVGASTIVTEWANDLGLGTGNITADATAVTLDVESKTYFDLLRWISDYWFSAGVQIKKDFFVDVDNNLVWKTRPIRTTGVESFTVGPHIKSYVVSRDVDPVKNQIYVYGNAGEKGVPGDEGRTDPIDKDAYTENDSTGWTTTFGTIVWLAAAPAVGTFYMSVQSQLDAGTHKVDVNRVPALQGLGKSAYKTLNFHAQVSAGIATYKVFIENTTTTNIAVMISMGGKGNSRASPSRSWVAPL